MEKQELSAPIDHLKPNAVSAETAQAFFDLLETGSTVAEASRTIGISRVTGHRLIARYEAKLDAALKVLSSKAIAVAEDWIAASTVASRKGDHRPAKELLQAIKAIDSDSSTSGGITIVIGTPERPIQVIPQEIPALSPPLLDETKRKP